MSGFSYPSGNAYSDAVEWTSTAPTLLGQIGTNTSVANAINDSNVVVGYAYSAGASGTLDAVSWTDGAATVLESLGGSDGSQAMGINASRVAVGYSDALGGDKYAVTWTGTTATMFIWRAPEIG